jgi:hypothetical protein
MFFTRSVLSSPEGPPLLPRRSRLFTVAVLAVAALLLILPEGREAIRTVRASWQEYEQSDSDARTLEKLAARAEKEKDASMLAFVALSTGDLKRSEVLTDLAVALNPQLFWVFGSHRPSAEL